MTQIRVPTGHFYTCYSWLLNNMSSDEWFSHVPHPKGYVIFEFFQEGNAMMFVLHFWTLLESHDTGA